MNNNLSNDLQLRLGYRDNEHRYAFLQCEGILRIGYRDNDHRYAFLI